MLVFTIHRDTKYDTKIKLNSSHHVPPNERNVISFSLENKWSSSLNISCFALSPYRHNGEVPSTRPKSDLEPVLHMKPKTMSGDWGEKTADMGILFFKPLYFT